jgi:hypothetical protein
MKRLILALIVCFFTVILNAAPVSREEAKQVAVNFYMAITNKKNISVKLQNKRSYKNTNTYYTVVFNNNDWVIVAGDDNIEPILAFSTEGSYSIKKPQACESLLNQYNEYIYHMAIENKKENKAQEAWTQLKTNNYNPSKDAIVSPLLVTKWGQSHPNDDEGNIEAYNYYMPDADDLDYMEDNPQCSTNCKAGCPAVAMGQILRYWERPDCPQFHWESMPEELIYHDNLNYQTERNAISSFLYYLGKLMDNEMDNMHFYCNDSSSCGSGSDLEPIFNVFKYLAFQYVQIIKDSDYSNNEWNDLLTTYLDGEMPVFYTGYNFSLLYNLYYGGHAFVLDGYFKNWVAYKYHVNWGWCGDYNGYYRTGNMKPDGHNFNYKQEAIINVYPTKCDTELDIYADDKYVWDVVENPNYFNPIKGTITSTPGEDPIIIENDETVHYKAYNKIVLENFETEDGANFTAEIIPCPVNCDFGIAPPSAKLHAKSIDVYNTNHKSDQIKLYPNPAGGSLTVNVGNLFSSSGVKMILFDAFGKKHMEKLFNNRELKIDIKKYFPGVYIIRIDVNGTSHYKKLIKK